MDKLPKSLIEQVRRGRAILFLGAGASLTAKDSSGRSAPSTTELRNRVASEFLTAYDNEHDTLAWVSELAASANDLFSVQDFIAEQFNSLEPNGFHLLIPKIWWRGIVTTNYDRLIEKSYENVDDNLQSVVTFLSNEDKIDELVRDPSKLILLKLHGCISRTHDKNLPLILSADQYARYRNNRSRLFDMFKEWGSENTIIFVGHSVQDPNLREILLDLDNSISSRPRYYLVRPGISREEQDFWASKNITSLNFYANDFFNELDSSFPKTSRKLAQGISREHPIQLRFIKRSPPSTALAEAITNDFDYLSDDMPYEKGNPTKFYKGFGLGWYPIIEKLDVRRRLESEILEDVVLRPEEDRPSENELYVIKAEAGAGKTVLLRRIAWVAGIEAQSLCLYAKSFSSPDYHVLDELYQATGERVFLFVDNAASNQRLIIEVMRYARERKLRITIITTERINEWNMHCETLEEYLTSEYKLHYLNHREINDLVSLLDMHDCLGPVLSKLTHDERVEEFHEKAGRQLLVALHEATHGLPYEEIVYNEYKNLVPEEAKRLYLTVCVMFRLNTPVRAGIISRIHSIPFEMFKERLYLPLEHVIKVTKVPWGDNTYECRHAEIAQIVFQRVLNDPIERFNEYINLIQALNPMYAVDNQALRGLLKAKTVHELFPNYEDARALYEVANQLIENDSYFAQQRANYERIRPSGNLLFAEKLLRDARHQTPYDTTIAHTLAEVLKSRAETTERILEKEKYRKEALSILEDILNNSSSGKYAAVTILKLQVDRINELLSSESTQRDIQEAIRSTERKFDTFRQRYPGDSHIYMLESDYATMIDDSSRSLEALKEAIIANPRDPFIARRLAAVLTKNGETDKAKQHVYEALNSNRGDKSLNFLYAELLRSTGTTSIDELLYYYKRAFTKWDENYQSQFWYARFGFESNRAEVISESREIFRRLRAAPIPHKERIEIKDFAGTLNNKKEFIGEIRRVESKHGFIRIREFNRDIFFHQNDLDDETWKLLSRGDTVYCKIGYTLNGPIGFEIRLKQ